MGEPLWWPGTCLYNINGLRAYLRLEDWILTKLANEVGIDIGRISRAV